MPINGPMDMGLGVDASEPFVDIVLLVTACSFTLLVGIIIGFYVEGFFRKQNIVTITPTKTISTDSVESNTHSSRSSNSSTNFATSSPGYSYNAQSVSNSSSYRAGQLPVDASVLNSKPSKVCMCTIPQTSAYVHI